MKKSRFRKWLIRKLGGYEELFQINYKMLDEYIIDEVKVSARYFGNEDAVDMDELGKGIGMSLYKRGYIQTEEVACDKTGVFPLYEVIGTVLVARRKYDVTKEARDTCPL